MSVHLRLLFALALCGCAGPTANLPGGSSETPPGSVAPDQAPAFALAAQDGTTVSLSERLKKGPLIVVFYRGQW